LRDVVTVSRENVYKDRMVNGAGITISPVWPPWADAIDWATLVENVDAVESDTEPKTIRRALNGVTIEKRGE
jgi:hypothetical protein